MRTSSSDSSSTHSSESDEPLLGATAAEGPPDFKTNPEVFEATKEMSILNFLYNYTRNVVLTGEAMAARQEKIPKKSDQEAYNIYNLYKNDTFKFKPLLVPKNQVPAYTNAIQDTINDDEFYIRGNQSQHILCLISLLVLKYIKFQKTGQLLIANPDVFQPIIVKEREEIDGIIDDIYQRFGHEKISKYIKYLKWYHAAEFSLQRTITEDDINNLFQGALQTDIIPLNFFLIKHSLEPNGNSLLSPINIVSLLSKNRVIFDRYIYAVLGFNNIELELLYKTTLNYVTVPMSYRHQLLWILYKEKKKLD